MKGQAIEITGRIAQPIPHSASRSPSPTPNEQVDRRGADRFALLLNDARAALELGNKRAVTEIYGQLAELNYPELNYQFGQLFKNATPPNREIALAKSYFHQAAEEDNDYRGLLALVEIAKAEGNLEAVNEFMDMYLALTGSASPRPVPNDREPTTAPATSVVAIPLQQARFSHYGVEHSLRSQLRI